MPALKIRTNPVITTDRGLGESNFLEKGLIKVGSLEVCSIFVTNIY